MKKLLAMILVIKKLIISFLQSLNHFLVSIHLKSKCFLRFCYTLIQILNRFILKIKVMKEIYFKTK